MKVTLSVIQDSWNSYPHDQIEFIVGPKLVQINMVMTGADDRELLFDREEFVKLLRLVEDGP